MEFDKRIKYWLDISQYDLETAEVMLEGKRFLYVGFMCHQAIEKILKGYYVSIHGNNPSHTHNLTYLITQCGISVDLSNEYKDLIDTLDPLNVEARYPTHKEQLLKALSYERCQEIIDRTRELYRWIKERLLKK